ncbi:MAG: hypothetical protein ACRYFX_26315 [Janthinobacterium lividum]
MLDPAQGRAAEMHRLRQALAEPPAPADSLRRFRLLLRLGVYLSYSPTPDSAGPYLCQARQAARPYEQHYPLEAATVLERLAAQQWRRQRPDSARYFHQQAIELLTRAFPDSLAAGQQHILLGKPVLPARVLAEHYANAGLASQALGQPAAALHSFDQARRIYQQIPSD